MAATIVQAAGRSSACEGPSPTHAMGIFGNGADSVDGLRAALESRFAGVEIATHGCVALFRATVPA